MKEKQGFWKIMQSKPALFILGIIILVFAWNIIGFLSKMKETAKNRDIATKNIQDLSEAKTKLSADIASLETEKGIEDNIREKFGLAKEGEQMIVIVEDKNQPELNPKDKKKGFFGWFKNLFK